ncbi:LAME_0G01046g1_1 [Lachancea meyersii CBS 8951]|uniref:LAME_0G01046g1_1 n=1 Tax=Lachancea meyersii CBS 8951 TaxID=1266667 RepID=A0A1G4K584_9SACH|nr:LAME_0G01046g1_1 [Lachancea meyersii CBS 8951]
MSAVPVENPVATEPVATAAAPAAPAAATPMEVQETEKVQKPVLSPAPVPTTSPWKAVPAASTGADSLANGSSKWPSTQEAVETLEKRSRLAAPAPAIKPSFGKEKWLPMQASIVVSGSKRNGNGNNSGPNNHIGGNNAGQANRQRSQTGRKPRRANTTGASSNNNNNNNSSSNASSRPRKPFSAAGAKQNGKKDSQVHSDSNSAIAETAQESAVASANSGSAEPSHVQVKNDVESTSEGSEVPQAQEDQPRSGFQGRSHHAYGQNNGYPRRKFHQSHQNESYGSFKSHHPHSQYPPKHSYNNFRQPRPYNPSYRSKPSHRNGHDGFFNSQQPPHPFVAVNNIARQLEYYFSAENLTKDEYLRSQFTKDGFAPLSLISKFYRIVNMSFGGDESLIMGALREIVANETATVDVAAVQTESAESPLDNYLIRSKDWQQWVSESASESKEEEEEKEQEEQAQPELAKRKILVNDNLDSFRIQPPVFASAPEEPSQHDENLEPDQQSEASENQS